VRGYGAEAINPQVSAYDREKARLLHEAGYGVYLWTVNDPRDLARFAAEPYVSGIITDWPQRLRPLVAGR